MKTLLSFALLLSVVGSTTGCIIVPRHYRPHGVHGAAGVPTCPPAHHWDGRGCRHNGGGNGNGNGQGRR